MEQQYTAMVEQHNQNAMAQIKNIMKGVLEEHQTKFLTEVERKVGFVLFFKNIR